MFNSSGPFTSSQQRSDVLHKTSTWKNAAQNGEIAPFDRMKVGTFPPSIIWFDVKILVQSLNYNYNLASRNVNLQHFQLMSSSHEYAYVIFFVFWRSQKTSLRYYTLMIDIIGKCVPFIGTESRIYRGT